MERTIKIRHIQKDIKVLDKTATAAEHLKGAYIRTRKVRNKTQTKRAGQPDLYDGRISLWKRGEGCTRNYLAGRKTGKKRNQYGRKKGQISEGDGEFPAEKPGARCLFFFIWKRRLYSAKELKKTNRD